MPTTVPESGPALSPMYVVGIAIMSWRLVTKEDTVLVAVLHELIGSEGIIVPRECIVFSACLNSPDQECKVEGDAIGAISVEELDVCP